MSYVDNVRASSKPSCWGKANTYDQNDPECQACRYFRTCTNEIDGRESVRMNPTYRTTRTQRSYETTYRPRDSGRGGEEGVHQPAVIEPDERPVERFAKDALSGGLRGMFYEMWQFWKHFRIR